MAVSLRWIGVALFGYAIADSLGAMASIEELALPLAAASTLYLFSYIALAIGLAGVVTAASKRR